MIADTLRTVRRLRAATQAVTDGVAPQVMSVLLVRAESAYFGYPAISAAIRGGANVPITTGLNSVIRTAISAIPADAWTPIRYTNAIYDDDADSWISVAEVAEIEFTAFAAQKEAHHIPGRLIVRRTLER